MFDHTSSDLRALLSVDDLTDDDITRVLLAAGEYPATGSAGGSHPPFSVGLLFLSSSLRTRVGFAAAAIRLGGSPIHVSESRSGPSMSADESFADTLRTVSGMVDVVVVRTPFQLDRDVVAASSVSPIASGGDGPGTGDHPTQALIDLFAIEHEVGNVADARIGICGDLGMRSARSLIKILNRKLPKSLALIAPSGRSDFGIAVGPELGSRISTRSSADFADLDVLYMVGLPEGDGEARLSAADRGEFSLNSTSLRSLGCDAVVLSPLPVIDEIDSEARLDPRIRMFHQSDQAVRVRMAVLEWLLGRISVG